MPLRTTKNKMRDINRLEAAVRKIEASVDVKREELEKANADISRTERQIRKQQEKMGSYAALHATEKNSKAQRFGAAVVQQENQDALAHAFETLKSRAMLADKRFNEAKAYNQTLRVQIDNMRREKRVFVRAFDEQERELKQLKTMEQKNRDIIDHSNREKEKIKVQMDMAKAEFAKKKKKLEDEVRELQKQAQLGDEGEEVDIMGVLGRNMKERQDAKAAKANAKKNKKGNKFHDRLKKMSFATVESDDDKRMMKNFGYYSDMWSTIRRETKLENIDDLVQVFLQLEQRKMARVKEANALVHQIRTLKAEERAMESERNAYMKENDQRMAKRKAFIVSLERDVAQCDEAIADLKAKNNSHRQIMESLASPVKRIYSQVINPELHRRLQKFLPQPLAKPVPGLALAFGNDRRGRATGAEVASSKIMDMMAFIEQRVTEMVQFYQAHMSMSGGGSTPNKKNNSGSGSEGGADDTSVFMNGPAEPTGTLVQHFKQARPRIMTMAGLTGRNKEADSADRPLSSKELMRMAQLDTSQISLGRGGGRPSFSTTV